MSKSKNSSDSSGSRRVRFTKTTVGSAKPSERPYDLRDSEVIGLLLRVYPTGSKTYFATYIRPNHKRTCTKLGRAEQISPVQARDLARGVFGDVAKGLDPQAVKKGVRQSSKQKLHTYQSYLEEVYGPWLIEHRKSGESMLKRLQSCFVDCLGSCKLPDITALKIETWRSKRLKAGIKSSTVNRDMTALKALLSKAVDWQLIDSHPLGSVKRLTVDDDDTPRFLTEAEEKRLRSALDKREDLVRNNRESGNRWRANRSYAELDTLSEDAYVDHLTPMVLLSLNTGLRRGELFQLTWGDVNIEGKDRYLTVRAPSVKTGRTRHVYLNTEAIAVLRKWQPSHHSKEDLVFRNKRGSRFTHVKTSWSRLLNMAGIENFRWHDMRHTFASNLVMKGVDLNTVREFLGHTDIKMTQRYAHLAPEHKAKVVELLISSG